MEDLDGKEIGGSNIEVSLAKPPSDKKKKEEILRARERRMMQMMQIRGGYGCSYLILFTEMYLFVSLQYNDARRDADGTWTTGTTSALCRIRWNEGLDGSWRLW